MSNKSINKNSQDILKNVGERLKKQKSKNKDSGQKKDNNQTKETKSTISKKNKKIEDKDTQYKTSFMVKTKYEKIYMNARFKIRRKFKSVLTKQDALELGLLLLDQIDEDILDEIVEKYSEEEDLIAALKDHIQRME